MKIENIPSRKLQGEYSVVEFGVGSDPFPPAPTVLQDVLGVRNPHWSFKGKRSYTGIDMGPAGLGDVHLPLDFVMQETAKKALARFAMSIQAKRPKENLRFIFGDILNPDPGIDGDVLDPDASINIADSSVHEILINNVLSSCIGDEKRSALLARAASLLTDRGLVVVRETFTPRFHKPDELGERLREAGFGKPHIVTPEHQAFDALTDYYGPTQHDFANMAMGIYPPTDRYFCIARYPEEAAKNAA